MLVHRDRIYGRIPLIKLIRESMTREEVGGSLRNQHFPVLVVEGFRGAGKTTLLSELEELLDQRVPYAKLDFGANRHAKVPQVLSALAFELSRKCRRYGVLQFPRFIIGQLVMGLTLDLAVHAQARSQVVAELERLRGVDTLRKVLAEAAGTVLATMSRGGVHITVGRGERSSVEPPGTMLVPLLEWLTARMPRRMVLGSSHDWYGHQDLGLTNDSIDVLVDLNRAAGKYEKDEHHRKRVDKLLMTAFLADLRTEFDRGRRAGERSLNCVVLLDDADTVLGRRFLHELVQVRRRRIAGGQDDADPLTVVATSRGALLADVPGADLAVMTPDDTPGEQRPRSTERSRPSWRRYPLPDLTEDEVDQAVAALDLAQINNQHLTRVVLQLTGGHPASTRLVLDAIARNPPANLIEPEVILYQAPSGDESHRWPTVEDQMLAGLLVGVSDTTILDLVTCSAASKQSHASALSAQDDFLAASHNNYLDILDPILWPADTTAGPILLRRLLQRRLARRKDTDSPSWPDVYGRLREARRSKGDETGELYYALAGGDLGFVTRRIHQCMATLEDKLLLDLLASATAAPRQHRERHALLDEARTLVRAVALEQPLTTLARLIAALWIAADPFSASDRGELHLQIAADYTEVARLTPDGPSAALLRESNWHRKEANWWS